MNTYLRFILLSFLFLLTTACRDNQADNKLVMVTEATFPPYEFYQGSKIVGIDADIVREIARRNKMEAVIEDMSFDAVITSVQSGKADVAAAGITVTEDRKKRIDFTTPYAGAQQVIIVPKDSPIKGPQDLKGNRIGVQHGTTGDAYITANIGDCQRFSNGALAVAALASGKLDVVILDNAPAKEHVSKNNQLIILAEPLTKEEYAMAISKERPELLQMFNRTLEEMKNDGTLQQILDTYLNKKEETTSTADLSFWGRTKEAFHTNFVKDDRWRYLTNGFIVTIEISLAAVVLGVVLGFLVAVVRSTHDMTGRLKFLNWLCHFYLTVIRGTPVVVQLLIIYFVIFGSFDVNKVLVAIIAFGINSGAYVAEIIRSGIMSVDRGQMEAGRSLGLSYGCTMRSVILPQAFKNVLPALGNEFIVLLKETSICGYIALQDLTKGGDIIRSQTYDALLPLMAVALIYLALVVCLSYLLKKLEQKLKKNER